MDKQKDAEVERLMRIRDQQIRARDPHVKTREMHRRIAEEQRRNREKFTLKGGVQDANRLIAHKWKGAIIGAIIGNVIWAVLAIAVGETWVNIVGLVSVLVLAIVGFMFGLSFDWRDEVSDI